MRFPKLVAAAAVAILAVSACGGGTATPTSAGAPTKAPVGGATQAVATTGPTTAPVAGIVDACKLLTPADLKAATGKEYGAGTLDSVGQCYWNLPGLTANTGSLIVGFVQTVALDFIKSSFGSGGVDVTVNGHAGFYNPSQGLSSIWVDVGGGQVFVLSFPQSNDLDPSYKAIAQKLAEIAVGNM